jgi:hypothetical protein
MMRQHRLRARSTGWLTGAPLVAIIFLTAACKSGGVEPNSSISALVGDWDATSLVITSVADPSIHPDLIQLGATFTLNVQPSGQYTAILVYNGQPKTEIGQLSVSGDSITLQPTTPSSGASTTGSYQVNGNHLTIDGDTEFDFNLDGQPDPAKAHFELMKK